MSVAQLQSQVTRIAIQGYPTDGSKVLPPRLERLCGYFAAEEHSRKAIAGMLRVSESTVTRVRKQPLVAARIRYLREQLRAAAYDAAPLVDKRNRVVMAAQLAETLHRQGQDKDWRDTVAVTKQGTEITGFDWRRTDQVRQLLDYIAKEVGDRNAPAAVTNVGVSISMEDAAVRVAALFSRMPDVIDAESEDVTPDASSEGGREG